MKIARRNFLLASSATLLAHSKLSFGSNLVKAQTKGKGSKGTAARTPETVNIYTTAQNTNQRLSASGTVSFKHVGQPRETQICVFVDRAKQFQTFMGIGGALTDASAETFAL
ncbi:MAG TPA: hypothetical protein VLB68_05310, partial [Pyrinomonadaceae bacterium]|nr:hypothetical protein [Pyrinomonadaceae bacterium]